MKQQIDYSKKENQTFKNWFKVMWGDQNIQFFLLGLTLLILQVVNWDYLMFYYWEAYGDVAAFILVNAGMLIPIGMVFSTSFFGFYKLWKIVTRKH